nr:G protein-coupled receptor [Proales similis]
MAMNSSNQTEIKSLLNERQTRIEVTTLSLLFTLTVIGNLTVVLVLVFFNQRKARGFHLRNITRMSFYIINLSLADLNVAFLSILPQLIWRISVVFQSSQILCKLVTFVQLFSVYASTFILIVMAYDRYTCICKPMKSCSWTYKSASAQVFLAWALAALFSSPQLILYNVKTFYFQDKIPIETCHISWPSRLYEGVYILFHATSQFILPLFILIFFYTKIFITVANNINYKRASVRFYFPKPDENEDKKPARAQSIRRQSNHSASINDNNRLNVEIIPMLKTGQSRRVNSSVISIDSSIVHQPPLRQNFSSQRLNKSKIKTLKLTLTVVIAYILCTMPFYLAVSVHFLFRIELMAGQTDIWASIMILTNLLFQLNSCANPFIYMVFSGAAGKILKRNQASASRFSTTRNMTISSTLNEHNDSRPSSRRLTFI